MARDFNKNFNNNSANFYLDGHNLYNVSKNALIRNFYWGQYEHILASRMVEEDPVVRKEAIMEYVKNEKYNKDRLKRNPNAIPRKFEIMKQAINYEHANNYR